MGLLRDFKRAIFDLPAHKADDFLFSYICAVVSALVGVTLLSALIPMLVWIVAFQTDTLLLLFMVKIWAVLIAVGITAVLIFVTFGFFVPDKFTWRLPPED